jgi:type IV secretion system protein VirD4
MRTRHLLIGLAAVTAIALGVLATAYLAGHAFYLLNRRVPHGVRIDTWYQCWRAYAGIPLLHKRLLLSLFAAAALVFGAPLVLLSEVAQRQRPLHGDARWATKQEIDKAGLL